MTEPGLDSLQVVTPQLNRLMQDALRRSVAIVPDPEIERLRTALSEIRGILGEKQERPWTTLSQIDQIARKALA